MTKSELIEPKFVMINCIGGEIIFYTLYNHFHFYRGSDANFIIRIKEGIGISLPYEQEEYEISEDEYERLLMFFKALSYHSIKISEDQDK